MSSCDMQGFATSNDLTNCYMELISKTKEERANDKYALLCCRQGLFRR